MKPVHSLLPLALASALAGQSLSAPPELYFDVNLGPGTVNFVMAAQEAPYIAVVLVSLSPNLSHYLVDLPPLLADPVVLTWGVANGPRFGVTFPEQAFPPGVFIYAQGVALLETRVVSSAVDEFVLDGSGGK
jgi:hypothetical protein